MHYAVMKLYQPKENGRKQDKESLATLQPSYLCQKYPNAKQHHLPRLTLGKKPDFNNNIRAQPVLNKPNEQNVLASFSLH